MITLEELYQSYKEDLTKIIGKNDHQHSSSYLEAYYETKALKSFFVDKNLLEYKHCFYMLSLCVAYQVKMHNSRLFDYATDMVSMSLLSDNWDFLENHFGHLHYKTTYIDEHTDEVKPLTQEEMVLDGESVLACDLFLQFIKKDFEKAERNLNIILKKSPEERQRWQYTYDFFNALLHQDKQGCEDVINWLVSPKIHRKFNDGLIAKYISTPAIGYAKLAWKMGVEVDVDDKYIPKEWLPINPLPKYEIEYDFLDIF